MIGNYVEIVTELSKLAQKDYDKKIQETLQEPVKIMPVMHAAASSAFQVLRELKKNPPRAIFMEGPPEFTPYIRLLDGCRLPVSLLATPRRNVEGAEHRRGITFPMELSSAEAQAVLYARHNNIPIFFVDHTVEHIMLADKERMERILNDAKRKKADEEAKKAQKKVEDKDDDDIVRLHSKMGVIVKEFPSNIQLDFQKELLKVSNTRTRSEYIEYYVDKEVGNLPFEAWRKAMLLEGVLNTYAYDSDNQTIRKNLSQEGLEFHAEVRRRDRIMWTNIKLIIQEQDLDPASTVFICGAAHAVTFVPEFGTNDLATFVPDPSIKLEPKDYDGDQAYHIGVLPNSHRSVDIQFGHIPGFTRRISDRFRQTCAQNNLEFYLPVELPDDKSALRPLPSLDHITDRDNPAAWAQSVVKRAREKHQMHTSTADAIAIAEATDLLATLRNRSIPAISDFIDGAVMSLAKEEDQQEMVLSVCYDILGISETGAIPHSALPALLKDFFQRLNHIPGVVRAESDTSLTASQIPYKINLGDPSQKDFALHYETSMLLWRMLTLLSEIPFGEGRFPVLPVLGSLELNKPRGLEDWRLFFSTSNIRKMIGVSLIAPTVEDAVELNFLELFRNNPPLSTALNIYIEGITLEIGQAAQQELETQLLGFADKLVLKDSYKSLTPINTLIGYYAAKGVPVPQWFHDLLVSAFQRICQEISIGFTGNCVPLELSQGIGFLDNVESHLLRWGVAATTQIENSLRFVTHLNMGPTQRTLLLVAQKKWFLISDQDFEQELKIAFSTMDNLEVCLGLMLSLFFYAKLAPKVSQLLHHNLSTLSDKALINWMLNLIEILKECPPHLVQTLLKAQQTVLSAPTASGASEVSIEDLDAFIAALAGDLDLPQINLEVAV